SCSSRPLSALSFFSFSLTPPPPTDIYTLSLHDALPILHMLQVRAKPRDIPEEIVVNVESLEIGDSISVSDVKETDKFEILDDEDATLVTILAPEEEEEEETEGTEEGLEPEL